MGTPELTSVPRVRQKREMATLENTGPSTGLHVLVQHLPTQLGAGEDFEGNDENDDSDNDGSRHGSCPPTPETMV